jgi:hypothetical protein
MDQLDIGQLLAHRPDGLTADVFDPADDHVVNWHRSSVSVPKTEEV